MINLALIFYCTLTCFTRMTISVLDETEIVSIVIDDVFIEEIIVIFKVYTVLIISFAIVMRLVFIGYSFRVIKHILFLFDIVHWQRMVIHIRSWFRIRFREQRLRLVYWCQPGIYVPVKVFQVQILKMEETTEHFVWNLYFPRLEDDIGESNYD